MCCRYYYQDEILDMMEDILASERIKTAEPLLMQPGRDVCPSDASAVICRDDSGLSAVNMRWGFSNPYAKGLIINARSETAREKNIFRDSIMNRRCIIPASGFYEWDAFKARFRFFLPGNEPVFMAGFYREEQGAPKYTILTTEANGSMKPVHDRMPVMVSKDEIRPWLLDNNRLSEFLERPQIQLIREQDSGQIRMDFGI